MQLGEGFLTSHEESLFRILALSVPLQALDDAVCEVTGRATRYYRVLERPLPSAWLRTDACDAWCQAAGISAEAFRRAVKKACAEQAGAN